MTAMLCLLLGETRIAAASAADPFVITDHGETLEFVVATDELHRNGNETGPALLSVQGNTSVEDVCAMAREMETTGTEDVQLVLYPRNGEKTPSARRYLTKKVVVQLRAGTDPLTIRAATGASYEGEVPSSPDHHVFSFLDAGDSLLKTTDIRALNGVVSADPLLARQMVKKFVPNDTYFTNQWHLLNTGQNPGALAGIDINVTNVWDNYRGSNIVVAVVDDGLQITHEDLTNRLAAGLHVDINNNDLDPSPNLFGNFHGTAVAGLIAAEGNNSNGVAGVAFEARLAGIRLISAPTTDLDESLGLLHRQDAIHISNNSWGPPDNGQLQPIGVLTSNALVQGTLTGRGGLGTIFVWAGGNGGFPDAITVVGSNLVQAMDNSNYDSYANQIYTISVGAIGDHGRRAGYSEPGANVVISAPSQGTGRPGMVTTDLQGNFGYNTNNTSLTNGALLVNGEVTNGNYTFGFNGTSASAPVASGAIALLLSANPDLGWRDIQEILIRSATQVDPAHPDWSTNAAGLTFNHEYGAGMLNVSNALRLATNSWSRLGVHERIVINQTNLGLAIPDTFIQLPAQRIETPLTNIVTVTNAGIRVEHVQLRVSLNGLPTRFLEIKLRSPGGMESLMFSRTNVTTGTNMNFTFMSVRHWGESATGDWEVEITDTQQGQNGILEEIEMTIWGTSTNAPAMTEPPAILAGGHPTSKAVTKGSSAFFRVKTGGTPPFTYRWLFTDASGNTRNLGVNSPSLFLNNVDASKQGLYAAEIFNQFGNTRSAAASLFVNSPPVITAPPTNTIVVLGGNASFAVQAEGNQPLGYQWRHQGSPLPGQSGATLLISGVQSSNLGAYDVIVSNSLASVISDPVFLSVVKGVTFTNVAPIVTNGTFSFSFIGATGQTVRIDGSDDFTNWTALDTRVLSAGSATFSDPAAGTNASRFYRVVPLP